MIEAHRQEKTMKTYTPKQADIMMLIVAFVWGSGFVATKSTLDSLSPMQIMSYRFIVASIMALIFFRKRLKTIDKKYIKAGVIMGIFLSTGYIFQTYGIQFTTAGNNAFITSTGVVMVPFIYWLTIKQPPKKNNLIAAFMMLVGVSLLTVDFSELGTFNIGDGLTLLGAFFFACHIVATSYLVQDKDPIILNMVQMFFCALFFTSTLLIDPQIQPITVSGLSGTIYLGLFSTFLCFSLQTTAQKFTGATHAAIILSLEAVFGSLLAIWLLSEGYNSIMIVGFVVIFFSVLMAEIGDRLFERRDVQLKRSN